MIPGAQWEMAVVVGIQVIVLPAETEHIVVETVFVVEQTRGPVVIAEAAEVVPVEVVELSLVVEVVESEVVVEVSEVVVVSSVEVVGVEVVVTFVIFGAEVVATGVVVVVFLVFFGVVVATGVSVAVSCLFLRSSRSDPAQSALQSRKNHSASTAASAFEHPAST